TPTFSLLTSSPMTSSPALLSSTLITTTTAIGAECEATVSLPTFIGICCGLSSIIIILLVIGVILLLPGWPGSRCT
ncbi:hypothetical protein PFISCL1PPCAC_251, partial [Pristionchus fissidentatus]